MAKKIGELNFKSELLRDYLRFLLNEGFKVYVTEPEENRKITYAHFVEGSNIGYVQDADFGGLSFSTVHKPNADSGTGFRTDDGVYEPTLEHARGTFVKAPYWGSGKSVVKYKNWSDYTKSSHGSILKKVEVTL